VPPDIVPWGNSARNQFGVPVSFRNVADATITAAGRTNMPSRILHVIRMRFSGRSGGPHDCTKGQYCSGHPGAKIGGTVRAAAAA